VGLWKFVAPLSNSEAPPTASPWALGACRRQHNGQQFEKLKVRTINVTKYQKKNEKSCFGNIEDFNPILQMFVNDYHIVGIDSRGHEKL
jgi:hypothetical protein